MSRLVREQTAIRSERRRKCCGGDLVALPVFIVCGFSARARASRSPLRNVCGIIKRQLIGIRAIQVHISKNSNFSLISRNRNGRWKLCRREPERSISSCFVLLLRTSPILSPSDNCGSPFLSLSFSLARLFEPYCVPNMPEHAYAHARVSHARTRSPSPFARSPEVSMNARDGSS